MSVVKALRRWLGWNGRTRRASAGEVERAPVLDNGIPAKQKGLEEILFLMKFGRR